MQTRLYILLFLLFSLSEAEAKQLYVDGSTGTDTTTYANNDSSNPWATIGRAAWGSTNRAAPNAGEAAQAGDTVNIVAGTYDTTEAVGARNDPVYNPVNEGTEANPITFIASGTVILTSTTTGDGEPIIGCLSKDYITWDGFTIDEANINTRSDTGTVVLWDTIGSKIKNCIIDGNGDPLWADNHNGIRLEGCDNGEVKNNTITNVLTSTVNAANGAGIMLYESDNNIIENNDISNCGSGIFVKGPGTPRNTNNTIRYNLIYSMTNGGIIFSSAEDCNAYQNIIRDSADSVRFWDLGAGAKPQGCNIVNNTLHNSTSQSLNLRDDLVSTNTVSNNIITDSPYMYYSETYSDVGSLTADYNCFDDYTTNFSSLAGGTETFTSWKSTYNIDTNSQDTDPLFVNEGADNFKLQGTSPALDFGVDILDLDNDGLTTDTVTIGAYITGNEIIGLIKATGVSIFPGSNIIFGSGIQIIGD